MLRRVTSRYTCHRFGMSCIHACGNCHGLNCTNSIAQQIEEDIKVDWTLHQDLKKKLLLNDEQFDLYALDMFWIFTAILVLIPKTILFT